jgi:hypothetical protein
VESVFFLQCQERSTYIPILAHARTALLHVLKLR